ncbi:MAG TPA: UbiD family decarboxylase [Streptosporangiaceae bacterium]|nr:UbiD family decarboxylase [Streptosporangiaceae bacterium]
MRSRGLVCEVRQADPRLEVGAITDLNAKREKHVLLFDEIRGYRPGFRILTGALLDAERVGYTLGCDPSAGSQRLVRELRPALRDPQPTGAVDRPLSGRDLPVFGNQLRGTAVDLSMFPAPLWHELDGGRYLGTFDAVVTRDPETGWVNVGTYRMMAYDSRRLCLFVNASHHARLHMDEYRRRGERLPVAVSLGHHPAFAALGGMELPAGVSEYDVIGRLHGGVELTEAPITGLPVPAGSEIVVEGHLSEETVPEGPYGEFLGYYAGGIMQTPVVEVEAVYYRDDPIILGTCAGIPPYDYSYFRCPMRSAMIWNALEDAGVPKVAGVWCHEAGYTRALNVVSISQAYLGHAQQAGLIASQVRAGAFGGKYTIVVDDDIDPADLDQVMWAMCTRTDPAESIEFVRHSWGMALDPMVERGDDDGLDALPMSRAVINACRPYKRRSRGTFPPAVTVPPAVAARVTERFPHVFERGQGPAREPARPAVR